MSDKVQTVENNGTMCRRGFLAAAATVATGASAALALEHGSPKGRTRYEPDAPPVRYPDPDVLVLDDRFKKYRIGNAAIRRIYHSKDMLWAEGPAWNGVGRYLLWRDIPNSC